MRVTFYGTRGSLPVPGPHTLAYGGNTTCTEVRSGIGTLIVIDLGTGAYRLGRELAAAGGPVRGHILISHTHWDHIQGLPFFAPLFAPGNEWDIYAPRGLGPSIRETLSGQMQHLYFPLELQELGATIRYHDLVEGEFTCGDVVVETHYLNHTALTLGYRCAADGAVFVHALDHEPFSPALADGTGPLDGADARHAEFLRDADLVLHDAQYTTAEYPAKMGWGHSTIAYAVRVAREAAVRRLALTHHDPDRTDDELDALAATLDSGVARGDVDVFLASEGMSLNLVGVRPDEPLAPLGTAAGAVGVAPALAEQSVILAGADPDRMQLLLKLLREDGIETRTCPIDALRDQVAAHQPTLVILVEDDPSTVRSAVRRAKSGAAAGTGLAVTLVCSDVDGPADDDLGVSDRLVEPFTPSYARARLRAWLMRRACHWARPRLPRGESDRLAALRALGVLDGPHDPRLEQLALEARAAFDVPVAAVTLIDNDRQWFGASCGLPVSETPRDMSFCGHIVADPAPLVVEDALLDPRFADNPAVVGPLHLRFYAGQPLMLSTGECIGSFCIADVRPRHLDARSIDRLAAFAERARGYLEDTGRRPASPDRQPSP